MRERKRLGKHKKFDWCLYRHLTLKLIESKENNELPSHFKLKDLIK